MIYLLILNCSVSFIRLLGCLVIWRFMGSGESKPFSIVNESSNLFHLCNKHVRLKKYLFVSQPETSSISFLKYCTKIKRISQVLCFSKLFANDENFKKKNAFKSKWYNQTLKISITVFTLTLSLSIGCHFVAIKYKQVSFCNVYNI